VKLAVDQLNKASKDAGLSVTSSWSQRTRRRSAGRLSAPQVVDEGATCSPAHHDPGVARILNGLTKRGRSDAAVGHLTKLRKTTTRNHLRTAPPDNLQALALIDAVTKQLGVPLARLSRWLPELPYGEGLANTFKDAWEKAGARSGRRLRPNLSNYNAEAGKIVANNLTRMSLRTSLTPSARSPRSAANRKIRRQQAVRIRRFGRFADSFVDPAAALNGAHATNAGSRRTAVAADFDKLYTSAPGPGRYALDNNMSMLASSASGRDRCRIERPSRHQWTDAKNFRSGWQAVHLHQAADAMKALRAGTQIHYMGVSGAINFDAKGTPAPERSTSRPGRTASSYSTARSTPTVTPRTTLAGAGCAAVPYMLTSATAAQARRRGSGSDFPPPREPCLVGATV